MVQRRLDDGEIDQLVDGYRAGRTLASLAAQHGLHERTVAAHLERRRIARRKTHRKLSEQEVTEAARRYAAGDSLAAVGFDLGVDRTTVRRSLQRAGHAIRPRHGWTT